MATVVATVAAMAATSAATLAAAAVAVSSAAMAVSAMWVVRRARGEGLPMRPRELNLPSEEIAARAGEGRVKPAPALAAHQWALSYRPQAFGL